MVSCEGRCRHLGACPSLTGMTRPELHSLVGRFRRDLQRTFSCILYAVGSAAARREPRPPGLTAPTTPNPR